MTGKTAHKGISIAATILYVAALVVSCILMWHSMSGSAAPGCGTGASCGDVLSSRWSMLFSVIPVSALAAGLYAAILVCLAAAGAKSSEADVKHIASSFIVFAAGAVIGSAVWFTCLQVFVLHEFCPWCMTAHCCGTIASCLVLYQQAPRRKWLLFAAGLAAAGIMALTQSFTGTAVNRSVTGAEALPGLSPEDSPLIGRKDASKVYEVLFDYQCSHCRKLHILLEEYAARHDDVAFILCPSPLDPGCNPYTPRDQKGFAGSCELTRLALAMWRISPQAFNAFDAWLFEADPKIGWYPRKVEEASVYAAELAGGQQALQQALSDPWIDARIATGVELFGRTTSSATPGIPRIIYGYTWVSPAVESIAELDKVLQDIAE